ncbi:hypothetical protein ASPZODRAFT_136160 [Penicilliopsis zonata CBS 506.65]|uniref:Sugar phosphate transporter domain-containing protein n=1 Tax=Penicilliopsis zonata CBS 506.65 TaxID=1073090 RepID=A0A1L9S992_9EURO|nr:hypothetical protein ASPZODRAFT_136160 [Penicilliopsis zonata CBS 506.65]OJJ43699.1 hypothetical protein ASPZODRAFT_136160 [Penicilliopsis zonata CBS 506.65]
MLRNSRNQPPARRTDRQSEDPILNDSTSSLDCSEKTDSQSSLLVKSNSERTSVKTDGHSDPEWKQDSLSTVVSVAHVTIFSWKNVAILISLIFGGCCANVFMLEAIIKDQPASGPLITFVQFLLIGLFTLPNFVSFSAGPQSLYLKSRNVPLRSWVIYTAFFLVVNLLNNWAFAYEISVPLHIIVRSGGPVASMIVGYIINSKRYSTLQILSVILLTLGVVGAALADTAAKSQSLDVGDNWTEKSQHSPLTTSLVGFIILALAMVLSALQGIYADRLYEIHGRNHWKEALFYSHTLSLPFFLPTYPKLVSQLRLLLESPPIIESLTMGTVQSGVFVPKINQTICAAAMTSKSGLILATLRNTSQWFWSSLWQNQLVQDSIGQFPIKIAYLLLNAVTQYLCIRGVHFLSAKSSSLTVTIVLNIRKLVSLLLSIHLFGNNLTSGIIVGAALVFLGGGLYGYESSRLRSKVSKKES